MIVHLACVLAMLASCQSSTNDKALEMSPDQYAAFDEVSGFSMRQPPSAMLAADRLTEAAPHAYPLGEQKLIRTATIRIEVVDYQKARMQIDSVLKLNKAWVNSENLNNFDYRISNDMILKVPSGNLDLLVNGLLSIAKKVEYQGVETSDVTEEFIDVKSRLKNQKAVEQKFLGLLRRTDSIDEILKIETKLAEVRGQIESMEGRIKYLNSRVDFSTIYLNVFQRIEYKFEPEPMVSFWEQLKNSMNRGWKGLVLFIFFLIRLWPLWIIGAGGWLIVRFFIKKKRSGAEKGKKKKKAKAKEKKNQNVKPIELRDEQ